MKNLITYQTLRSYAYSNDKICMKPIKGIVINFLGLNGPEMYDEDPQFGQELADKGIVYIIPYTNPWAWMNEQALIFTEEIISIIIRQYDLSESIPIVPSGGSMGGLAALVYAKQTKHSPVACVVNCPVCDLVYQFKERPDVPRTLYSTFFFSDAETMEEALKGFPLSFSSRFTPNSLLYIPL